MKTRDYIDIVLKYKLLGKTLRYNETIWKYSLALYDRYVSGENEIEISGYCNLSSVVYALSDMGLKTRVDQIISDTRIRIWPPRLENPDLVLLMKIGEWTVE